MKLHFQVIHILKLFVWFCFGLWMCRQNAVMQCILALVMWKLSCDLCMLLGSQDVNDEFSKLSAHEARQRLAVLLQRMDTNSDSLISQQEIADWVMNSFRCVWHFLQLCMIHAVFNADIWGIIIIHIFATVGFRAYCTMSISCVTVCISVKSLIILSFFGFLLYFSLWPLSH